MPRIDRRDFVKLVGAGSIGTGAGFLVGEASKHPVELLVPYPVPPEDHSPGVATWYNSACSMCSAGCGISVRTREGRAKKIEGNPAHPVNQGRLCARGQAGLQALYNPDRLTGPLVRTGDTVDGPMRSSTWDQELPQLAERLEDLRRNRNGNRVAFLSGGTRGHVANLFDLFMGELGSKRMMHFDFAHPHTLYAANLEFFGESFLPYYDIEKTQFLLSFGADFLGNWISPVHHSLGFGRSRQEPRGHFVQIEPRMSVSGAAADDWIPARPGTEGILALGMAHHIVASRRYRGSNRRAWIETLSDYAPESVAEQTGVPVDVIEQLAEKFADTRPSLAIGGNAAAHNTNGTQTLAAVNALNYLAGNVGIEGGVIFNPAPAIGQGTRTRQTGYRKMLEFLEDARQGRIEILFINDVDPVFALPEAAGVREALLRIPLIVSLSSFMDDTTSLAGLILPSHTYLESWGDDIPEPGVGLRVATISQPVVAPLYDTRATGDIILGLTQHLDLRQPFPWTSMEEVLRQGWRRIYRRSAAVDDQSFDAFWDSALQAGVWGERSLRLAGSFTPSRTAIRNIGVESPDFAGEPEEYPFALHPYLSTSFGDGRAANLPWMQELPDPMTGMVYGSWVELNPETATQLDLAEGDLVSIESPHGKVVAPVLVYPAIRPDVIAMPIGQGHERYGRYASQRGTNPIRILAPVTDTETGSLAWSATRVKLVPTGRRVRMVKSGGGSRQLGRDIVQSTGAHDDSHQPDSGQNTDLNSIPVEVKTT
jgi:anaerobic selenocysteine-containing dehydrogenase